MTLTIWRSNIWRDVQGGVAILFAVTLPLLLLFVGMAIDYGYMSVRRTDLQSAADASALAAARELQIATADNSTAEAIARDTVFANLEGSGGEVSFSTTIDSETGSVTVHLSQSPGMIFLGGILGQSDADISVEATAKVIGSTKICVLGLDDTAAATVSVEVQARLTGNDCAVFSNSTSSQSLVAKNSAILKASLLCSAGGYSGSKANFDPKPLTDCPKVLDPLSGREPPFIGNCVENWLLVQDEDRVLSPGVYCGGIQIYGNSKVTLQSGIYIIKDGPFIVGGGGQLIGENVGFYLTGGKAIFNFVSDSTIELSAPTSGPLAGLLFFEDRNRKKSTKHTINSNNARLLLGTIYLPSSDLVIDANSPVADQSAYTAIVAKGLKLYNGPHLVLNTNYDETDIPVPEGIRGVGQAVALTD